MACIASAKRPVCSPTAIMSVNKSGNNFCSCKAADSVAPSITALRTSRSFSYQVERAEQGDSVFHQCPKRPGELCVITVAYDAAVTGDHQAELVPRDAAIVGANKCPKTDNRANSEERADPPVSRDRVMNLQQDAGG